MLNEEIFETRADARHRLELWRHDDNHVRSHSSLGGLTPGALATPDSLGYESK